MTLISVRVSVSSPAWHCIEMEWRGSGDQTKVSDAVYNNGHVGNQVDNTDVLWQKLKNSGSQSGLSRTLWFHGMLAEIALILQ